MEMLSREFRISNSEGAFSLMQKSRLALGAISAEENQ